MSNTVTPALTPLERLQLREALQDLWRDEVRRITELSVALHSTLDADEDRPVGDATAVAVALGDARLKLAELEQAMRRLDDRSYGRCLVCLAPIPFATLIQDPDLRNCSGCRDTAGSGLAVVAGNRG